MGRKTSLVWNHFKIPEMFPKKAMCNYCGALFGRGQKNMGTTSLLNHLKRCPNFKIAMLAANGYVENPENFNFFAESPNPLKYLHEGGSDDESNPFSTSDIEINPLSPSDNESSLPSLVLARSIQRESQQPPTQEYHSNGRPSSLLYGDINSSTESVEEPSSSNMPEPSARPKPPQYDPMSYLCLGKDVNFAYGGFMLHMLYEQYKAGLFCDLQLVTQSKVSNEGMISETGKITRKSVAPGKEKSEVKVHTCLLAALSKKISVLVEMGCTAIQLKKGSHDSVCGLMEIVYTGKLGKIRSYTSAQLSEILEVAKFLEVHFAINYLLDELAESKLEAKTKKLHQKKTPNGTHFVRNLEAMGFDPCKPTSSLNITIARSPLSQESSVRSGKRKQTNEAKAMSIPQEQPFHISPRPEPPSEGARIQPASPLEIVKVSGTEEGELEPKRQKLRETETRTKAEPPFEDDVPALFPSGSRNESQLQMSHINSGPHERSTGPEFGADYEAMHQRGRLQVENSGVGHVSVCLTEEHDTLYPGAGRGESMPQTKMDASVFARDKM